MGTAEDLQKTDLFNEVALSDLEALVRLMHREAFSEGQILFNEGDDGNKMYIITSGSIRIFFHDQEKNEVTLKFYGEHDIFGELSPIDERPRSASADAAEALEVMVLEKRDFLNFLEERPEIGLAMMRSLSQRLRYTTAYLEEFSPEHFVTKAADRGLSSRRPAQKEMAALLDKIIEKSGGVTRKHLPAIPAEKPDIIESPEQVEMPAERLHGIFDLGGHADEDVSVSGNMGLFDKLGGSLAQKDDESEEKE